MRTKKLLKLRKARREETIRRVTNQFNAKGFELHGMGCNRCVLCLLYKVYSE